MFVSHHASEANKELTKTRDNFVLDTEPRKGSLGGVYHVVNDAKELEGTYRKLIVNCGANYGQPTTSVLVS